MNLQALIEQFVSEARRVMSGQLSFSEISRLIGQALRAENPPKANGEGEYLYPMDVYPSFFVYEHGGKFWKREYSVLDGQVKLSDQSTELRQEWVEVAKEAWAIAQNRLGQPDPEPAPADAEVVTETFTGGLPENETALESVGGMNVLRGVTLIRVGESLNRRQYTESVLERDGPAVFEGVPAYMTNHNPQDKNLRNMVGVYRNVRFSKEKQSLQADLYAFPAQRGLLQTAVEAQRELGADRVGLSIDTAARFLVRRTVGRSVQEVERLFRTPATSVDIVVNPAAGGRLTEAVEDETMHLFQLLTAAVLAGMSAQAVVEARGELSDERIREMNPQLADQILAKCREAATPPTNDPGTQQAQTQQTQQATETQPPAAAPAPAPVEMVTVSREEIARMISEGVNTGLQEVQRRTAIAGTVESLIAAAKDLGGTVQSLLRERFARETFASSEAAKTAIEAAITQARESLGRERPVRPWAPAAGEGVRTEAWDKQKARLEAFFMRRPIQLNGQTIEGFQSFRWEILPQLAGVNAYDPDECRRAMKHLMWGGDLSERVRAMESIQSTTFDDAWADVLYRTVLAFSRAPNLMHWQQWTRTVPFQDLDTQKKFTRVGGYGSFSQVNQGAPYGYVTTPGDEKVQFVPSKYGGLEKLTWESILRDDVSLIASLPMRLGRGWAWTVHDIVYGAFQENTGAGPAMDYDSYNLYDNTNHANVVDAALSKTAWISARLKMRKQTELSSGKRALYIPGVLLYSTPDLDETAWELFGQGQKVTTNSDATMPNFLTSGEEPGVTRIPVIYPTTTTQRWEVVANPADADTMLVGFLGGRFDPDILTQDGETSEGMFNSDTIRIKLRGTCGVQFVDHRSFVRGQTT